MFGVWVLLVCFFSMIIFWYEKGSWEYFQIYKDTFLCDFNVVIFLVWMGVIRMFGGIGKKF